MAQLRRKYDTDRQTGERKQRKKWYIRYRNANGRWQEVPGYTDKRATEALSLRLETQAQRVREGLVVPSDAHERTPLTTHLADFEGYLRAKGGIAGHATQVIQRVRRTVEGCAFKMIADIALSKVQAYVAKLTFKQQGKKAIERPASLQTRNYYIGAIKHFVNWMVRDGRMTSNPLAGLSRYNVATCSKGSERKRRALTLAEVVRVIEATKASSTVYRGLTGEDRAMLYSLAIGTGLRASELASLTPNDFNFSASPAIVRVRACYTKDRKAVEQPIVKGVAESLRRYVAEKPPQSRIWPGSWREKASKITRKDLALAGIPGRTTEGLFDFHGWRHTYVTFLVTSGINPKLAQSLARHSDIRLTMDRYAHLQQHERLEAVKSLPALFAGDAPILSHTCPHEMDSDGKKVQLIEMDRDCEHKDSAVEKSPTITVENEETPGISEGFSQWTEPGMIRRPKDFQSVAVAQNSTGNRAESHSNEVLSLPLSPSPSFPDDLQAIIEAWPKLTAKVKKAMLVILECNSDVQQVN